MKTLIAILSLFALFGIAQDSAAQDGAIAEKWMTSPSIFYYTTQRKRNSDEQKTYSFAELKAGYQFANGWFAGGVYQLQEENLKNSGFSDPTDNNTVKATRTSWGPYIGYIKGTYHAALTYFYESKNQLNKTNSTGTTKYSYKGNGFQLDAGYKIPLGGGFFGPQLSYKTYTYSKLDENSISPKLKETGIEPSLTYFFFF